MKPLNPWIRCSEPNPAATLRLFCFPYAGGNANLFRTWSSGLPDSTEVCAIQLPGRGDRLSDPLLTTISDVIAALVPDLLPYLDRPYAFFGHSMGALLAFELARYLQGRSLTHSPLQHLIVSGRRAPTIGDRHPTLHTLPDAEFLDELRKLNGTSPEVLAHEELMQFFLPILRADFSICGTYVYQEAPPLSCPITVLGGEGDRSEPPELLTDWKLQTQQACSMHLLTGDHFFIQSQQAEVLEVVGDRLISER
jgi:medium-chain acyl-[acyl-carrier-protein] hydrolase